MAKKKASKKPEKKLIYKVDQKAVEAKSRALTDEANSRVSGMTKKLRDRGL